MSGMKVKICGVEFKNPIIAASGTFGYGWEMNELWDVSKLGGISLKGLTVAKRLGNKTPRIAETNMGMLNSVGLQNCGVDTFLEKELPLARKLDTVLIANIAGSTAEEYVILAQKLSFSDVDMIELNISCPNVKEGGIAFGVLPASVYAIVSEVKKHCAKPLIVKLTPNVSSIKDNAKAAEDAGADCISLINTVTGMAIDLASKRPVLANNIGGLSGPAVKPIALKMINDCYNAVKLPIIGMGGITTVEDVMEFIVCGATAVQVGTATLSDPFACLHLVEGLKKYLTTNHISDIVNKIGTLKLN